MLSCVLASETATGTEPPGPGHGSVEDGIVARHLQHLDQLSQGPRHHFATFANPGHGKVWCGRAPCLPGPVYTNMWQNLKLSHIHSLIIFKSVGSNRIFNELSFSQKLYVITIIYEESYS